MNQEKASKKQRLIGTVVSDKMNLTVVVKVDMQKRHTKYKKTYTVSKRFKAHSPNNEYHVGDKVEIESIKPMSKEKKFLVIKKV
jgi:small subunit ribosomal protein S17